MKNSKPLLDVLSNRSPQRRPVWLMRQAGRYLSEYRAVRQKAGSFLDLCYSPQLAAEVTLQPLRRFDFDAAILFSDILVVPHAMGCALKFVDNEGPQLETVSGSLGVGRLQTSAPFEQFDRVAETVSHVRSSLSPGVALIGFCGAPWTVASYMIEGRSSQRQTALAVAAQSPPWFESLIEKLVDVSVQYLIQQIAAGAEVVQIFDSWAGDLPVSLRERWVDRPIRAIVDGVRMMYPDLPVIVFARGVGSGHGRIALSTNANAVGVEQGISLADVMGSLRSNVAVQGNLNPHILAAGGEELEREVSDILDAVPRDRHIFNLGHGILPTTDVSHVEAIVSLIRRKDALDNVSLA